MNTIPEEADFNKSAYVALSCLIAFVIVITICVIKQFIWDPLLSRHFQVLRPVLSESVRKLSLSFHRPHSTLNSNCSIHKTLSDACIEINNSPLLSPPNLLTVTQSLPSNNNQQNPINKKLPPRSYGSSSFNSHAYTNYGSDDLNDEQINTPILHFSCEYNPSLYNIKINIQNLRHMNIFNKTIDSNAYISIRFVFLTRISDQTYETSPQHYQDFIRFGETFIISNNIHPDDLLNYRLKFSIIFMVDKNTFEIGEATYSMKDDYLTDVLFIERTLPMHLE